MLALISPPCIPFLCCPLNPPLSSISYLFLTLTNSPHTLPYSLFSSHTVSCNPCQRMCHLHNLNYSLICHPGSKGEGLLLRASLMVESALQESSSSTGHGLPGRNGWSILKIDFSCNSSYLHRAQAAQHNLVPQCKFKPSFWDILFLHSQQPSQ